MKTELDDSIIVTHAMGGMIKFIEKGTYHNSLRISSLKYDKVWRVKMKDDKKEGLLRVNRKPVYNYSYGDSGFKVQEIDNGVPVSEWITVDVIEIMQD